MFLASDYLQHHNIETSFDEGSINSFVILSDIERSIKNKIEAVGTPLKDWDINIYRGILTGYNEAFIIDGKTRDELISKDSKNREIIKPLLRGRDIKRYGYEFSDLWLLYIPWHFPLHKDPMISGASKEAEEEFKKQYPDIYNHLLQFKIQLSNRNQAETGIRYEWYALQRWGANYMDDFFKQKIIYPEITKFINFHLDDMQFITNNKCFIVTGEHVEFLIGFLNSSLFKYSFINDFPELLGGTRELRKVFIEKIPIIKVNADLNNKFKIIINDIQQLRLVNSSSRTLEVEIDNLIFDLYKLTKEERETIGFIEIL